MTSDYTPCTKQLVCPFFRCSKIGMVSNIRSSARNFLSKNGTTILTKTPLPMPLWTDYQPMHIVLNLKANHFERKNQKNLTNIASQIRPLLGGAVCTGKVHGFKKYSIWVICEAVFSAGLSPLLR